MADEYRDGEQNTRKETVVVTEGRRSSLGWVIALIILLLLLFFFVGNPFAGSGGGDGTDVNVTPSVNQQ